MAITQDSIRARLDRIKKQKQITAPDDYREFMPTTLRTEPLDPTLAFSRLDSIGQQGENASAIAAVQAQNEKERRAMIQAQQDAERARQEFEAAKPIVLDQTKGAHIDLDLMQKPQPNKSHGRNVRKHNNPNRANVYEGSRNFGPRWGKDNTPEVSDLNSIHAHAPIVNVQWRGRSFNVNKQVAPIFVAFLDDLWQMGYRPKSIGGYANRNIAGTNTQSLHALGLAIDIDPTLNPAQPNDGSMIESLPPKVGALARKYGLSWGGSWNSYKDPMHFSVAYGGRE